jgi:TetR/AcrR family transcriptional regulator, mexCD-oprJ operon repressor
MATVDGTAERRRRSDAERNEAAIIDAGRRCLGRDPSASMTEIAREAGLGRVTIYAYFSSREDLLRAVLREALHEVAAALDAAAPEEGDPEQALLRLIERCWDTLDTWMGVRAAVLGALGEEVLRTQHGSALGRLERLLLRGQEAGVFRTDLPLQWLVATCYAVMHAAQGEVAAGRLPRAMAAATAGATLRSALAA